MEPGPHGKLLPLVLAACLVAPTARGVGLADLFGEPRLAGTRPGGEALSPDEHWVAFAWNPAGRDAPLDLFVVPAHGGEARALTAFPRNTRTDSVHAARATPRADSVTTSQTRRDFDDETLDYRVESIAWEPNSRRIAFVARGDLYLAGVAGGSLERLTVTRAPESQPAWSPDGRWLAYVRDGAVWALQMDAAREVQLTPAGADSVLPSALQWSPDGRRLAFTTRDQRGQTDLLVPNYLTDRVTAARVKEGAADMDVRVVDAGWLRAGRDPARLVREHPFPVVTVRLGPGRHPQVSRIAWSPDGRELAVSEIAPDMRTRKLHVARADSGGTRTVYTETDTAWVEEQDWVIANRPVLEWSPDGRWILIATETSGWRHLARVPAEGGKVEPLTSGAWEVGWADWLPDGRRILLLGSRADAAMRQLEVLDLATGALESLGCGPGMSTHPQLCGHGTLVLYRHSRFAVPTDLWTLELRPGARPVQVTHSVPDRFQAVDWVVPEVVRVPGRQGPELRGLLYAPRVRRPGWRYPAVVFVHGAGSVQNVVDGWTYYAPNFMFHTRLVDAGYVVLEVDYRGSLGYGRDFRAAVHGHLGGKDLDDELAGVDYLKGLGWVDSARVGIYGGSYGGFLTLMALFRAPEAYACGAALRSVADWSNYYRSNPGYCVQRLGTPGANPEAYARSSPIHFAAGLERPLLLVHGMRDDNVHFQDAAQLTERLVRLGKRFELMIYPREGHEFVALESWIDEYRRIESFFDAHLHPTGVVPGSGSMVPGGPR